MFKFDVPLVDYKDPWSLSFTERLTRLTKGNRRVAYFYDAPDTSTFRYRVYNMIQALDKTDISASYFHAGEMEKMPQVIEQSDVLVFCRTKYTVQLDNIITLARNKGKRVFFDVDDLIFDTSYVTMVLDTLDQYMDDAIVWDFWFACIGRIGGAMRLCERMITTNSYLATMIKEYTNKPVSIIPNFLNREQLDLSSQIFKQKKASGFCRDGKFHIGYFSGTPTHNRDLAVASDALVKILSSNPEVRLSIVGFMDLGDDLKKFDHRIERHSLQDFINLQHLIGSVELNIVPLQDNIFTNCKSELKYFEAGAVGTVSIASPTFTYKHSINDGDNGYLAKSFEWRDKIETVMNSMDNYPEFAERAHDASIEKYAWYNQAELIEKVLFP